MTIGLILITIGVVFFARSLGYLQGETIDTLWPLLLIVLGLSLLSHKVLGHDCDGKNCWCGGNVTWKGLHGKKRK